jgi:hypothetical protein
VLGCIRDHVRISNSCEKFVIFREDGVFFLEHGVHPGHTLGGRYGFLPLHGASIARRSALAQSQLPWDGSRKSPHFSYKFR